VQVESIEKHINFFFKLIIVIIPTMTTEAKLSDENTKELAETLTYVIHC